MKRWNVSPEEPVLAAEQAEVALAWEEIHPEGKTPMDQWCAQHGVAKADSIEQVIDQFVQQYTGPALPGNPEPYIVPFDIPVTLSGSNLIFFSRFRWHSYYHLPLTLPLACLGAAGLGVLHGRLRLRRMHPVQLEPRHHPPVHRDHRNQRGLLGLLLPVAAWLVPVAAQDVSLTGQVIERTLPNGLKFIVVGRHDTPVFSFATVVNAGAANDAIV